MSDRVALVTGANTGIGLAIAERLLADGWALGYATQDDEERHEGPLRELQGRYGEERVHWTWGNLADPDVPPRLVAETVDAHGRLDSLVNNAGLSTAKPFLELEVGDFDLTFAVDVRGSFLAAQAAARHMRDRGGGSIVNITSVHEHIPRPDFAVYAAAKAALGMLSRATGARAGRGRHPRQLGRSGRDRHAPERGGRGEARPGGAARPARASRRRWPRSSPGSARTRPPTSPARAT